MSALRVLFTWLLLAALPLQGFAAATTLLCGPAHHGTQVSAAVDAGHGHAVDGDGHHPHAAASMTGAHDASAGADAAVPAPDGASPSCNLCSAACHGLGIASQPLPLEMASAPHVPLAEAFRQLASRPAPVPDKPPRA